MAICNQCGGEATNKLSPDLCMACLERAMDDLTPDDIGEALRDIAGKITEPIGEIDPAMTEDERRKLALLLLHDAPTGSLPIATVNGVAIYLADVPYQINATTTVTVTMR